MRLNALMFLKKSVLGKQADNHIILSLYHRFY